MRMVPYCGIPSIKSSPHNDVFFPRKSPAYFWIVNFRQILDFSESSVNFAFDPFMKDPFSLLSSKKERQKRGDIVYEVLIVSD